jgi:hypothetical protein
MGTHAVVVVGYGKLKNGRIAYICHDSFGDFPKNYEQDAHGAPAYRYVLAEEIDEAIVFPHKPAAKAFRFMNGLAVKVFNRAGRPVPLRRAFYFDPASKKVVQLQKTDLNTAITLNFPRNQYEVQVYVEAEYYMSSEGKGYWMKMRINNKDVSR